MLNPKAVVPTLVHDGSVVVESTVINEYLDDVFPDPPLKPAAPEARAAMRVWTKAVDEDLHPACAEVTFSSCHRHIIRRLPREEYDAFLAGTPAHSVTPRWHARKKEIVTLGFDAPGLEQTYRLYDSYLGKMEKALEGRRWLAGDSFSLADVVGRALRQPPRHAGHGRDVDEVAPWRHRLVHPHQGAAGVQARIPRLVPARPHCRSRDLRSAELARGAAVIAGLT